MTTTVLNTKIGEVENKIPDAIGLEQIMTLKYQKSRENILLLLVIIVLQVAYLMHG